MPTADTGAESAGDAEAVQEVDLDCDECGDMFSVTIRAHFGGWEVYLTEDPGKKGEVEHYDYSYDDEPPPEPGSYGIFLAALDEWRFNVSALATEEGSGSRNRMLFTTLYSIVEAYLSDAITGAALSNDAILGNMLKLDGLRGKTVSLQTVFERPSIVREMVRAKLRAMSFHNLRAVNAICRTAFGRPLLPNDEAAKATLMGSVDKRHDCVHRNGRDREGNLHTDLTKSYLTDLGSQFELVAQTLEDAIQDAKVSIVFENLTMRGES